MSNDTPSPPGPTPTDPPPSVRIPGYELRKWVGSGSFGVVHKAARLEDGREVAIKLSLPAHHGPASVEILRREAETLLCLDHPHIAPCLGHGRIDDFAYLVLPYYVGGSLGEEEQQRRLRQNPSAMVGLAKAILSALMHSEEKGLVHRDLKQENVLFDLDDVPVLSDFGAGIEALDLPTRETRTPGTTAYMSPEQFIGDGRQVDSRTDLWALGVLLYTTAIGRPPFGVTREEVIVGHALGADLEALAELALPAEIVALCERCLTPRTGQSSAHALYNQVFGEPGAKDPSIGPSRQTLFEIGFDAALSFAQITSALTSGKPLSDRAVLDVLGGIVMYEKAVAMAASVGLELPAVGLGDRALRVVRSPKSDEMEVFLRDVRERCSCLSDELEEFGEGLALREPRSVWFRAGQCQALRIFGVTQPFACTPEVEALVDEFVGKDSDLVRGNAPLSDGDSARIRRTIFEGARRLDRMED